MWYKQQLDAYGLTVPEYRSMLATGKCAACGLLFEDEYHPADRRPYVDHCHETGKVRGLVHHKCNAGLGAAGDDHAKLFNWQVHLHRAEFDLRDLCVSQ